MKEKKKRNHDGNLHMQKENKLQRYLACGAAVKKKKKNRKETGKEKGRTNCKAKLKPECKWLCGYPPTKHLFLWFSHPWIPHLGPFHNSKSWSSRVNHGRTLPQELAVPHSSLLAQRGTFLLLDESVELALDSLKPAPLAVGKLAVEVLAHLLPLLAEVDPVVPDEVHLFFFVLGPGRPTPFGGIAGTAGDGVIPVPRIRIW